MLGIGREAMKNPKCAREPRATSFLSQNTGFFDYNFGCYPFRCFRALIFKRGKKWITSYILIDKK